MTGRKPGKAPEGYMTIQEAADALGVTTNAIRGRYERGTLKGTTYQRETLAGTHEPRHAISIEAVEKELSERSEVATRGDVAPIGHEMRDLAEKMLSEISKTSESIEHQESAIVQALNAMTERLDRNNELLLALNRWLEEDVAKSQPYRDKVERYLDAMAEERGREAGEALEAEERPSFWRRWFG